ncbi:MAG TPA: hypothetical protein VNT76_20035 [Candidatus Binatus sp.]|nr:hypothetical protein [Candidatus Binatus sp.]
MLNFNSPLLQLFVTPQIAASRAHVGAGNRLRKISPDQCPCTTERGKGIA